jgi:uncharacterized protein
VTRGRRILVSALVFAGLYVGAVVLARLCYRSLLYPAPPDATEPLPDGATLLTLRASDGVPVHALEFLRADAKRTIVLFHGNGERMEWNADLAERLRARGLNVVLAEYRGYGRSKGEAPPGEEGLYRDATAILDALTVLGIGSDHIVLWGQSLGTGVASEMARRGRGAALVLASPFTSVRAVGARLAPMFPMRLVLPDAYDTLQKAPEIHVPTLVIHGDRDEVVPYDMGQSIAAAIPGARLLTVAGGHHNDLFSRDGERILAAVVDLAL